MSIVRNVCIGKRVKQKKIEQNVNFKKVTSVTMCPYLADSYIRITRLRQAKVM